MNTPQLYRLELPANVTVPDGTLTAVLQIERMGAALFIQQVKATLTPVTPPPDALRSALETCISILRTAVRSLPVDPADAQKALNKARAARAAFTTKTNES